MGVSREEFILLENRVEKLERKQKRQEQKELKWALNQLENMVCNEEQEKALEIIDNYITKTKSRTTSLRPKKVRHG